MLISGRDVISGRTVYICALAVGTESRNGLWPPLAPACPCWCKALSATLGFSQLSAMINWVQYYLGARNTSRSALKPPQAINQLQVEVRKPKLRRTFISPSLRILWGIHAAEGGKYISKPLIFLAQSGLRAGCISEVILVYIFSVEASCCENLK